MLVYFLVACDRLEEKQERKLRQSLPELQAALRAYAQANTANHVTLIDACDSEDCAEWELGISQPVKKSIHLTFPVDLFNDLAKKHGIDCEVGLIEDGSREPVSYFGAQEGRGEAVLIAEYLGL